MIDAAIFGSSANRAGVIDAPTATPTIVLAATETCPKSAIGPWASAAIKQTHMGPNKNGNGKSDAQKISVPRTARPSVTDLFVSREGWFSGLGKTWAPMPLVHYVSKGIQ